MKGGKVSHEVLVHWRNSEREMWAEQGKNGKCPHYRHFNKAGTRGDQWLKGEKGIYCRCMFSGSEEREMDGGGVALGVSMLKT